MDNPTLAAIVTGTVRALLQDHQAQRQLAALEAAFVGSPPLDSRA
jgi:hypothetical protein